MLEFEIGGKTLRITEEEFAGYRSVRDRMLGLGVEGVGTEPELADVIERLDDMTFGLDVALRMLAVFVRGRGARADEGDCTAANLNFKPDRCPFGGMGKNPAGWPHCFVECSCYDATMGCCSIAALWHLRELPAMERALDALAGELA